MRIFVLILALVVAPGLSLAEEKKEAPPKEAGPKIEFRWLEDKPIPGLTEEKGIHISETEELSYAHLKPILTNADIVGVKVSSVKFGGTNDPNEHFMLTFDLTAAARKRLAETCGDSGSKMLVARVDGRQSGAPFYLKSRDGEKFTPFAGGITSKQLVDRIVAAFGK